MIRFTISGNDHFCITIIIFHWKNNENHDVTFAWVCKQTNKQTGRGGVSLQHDSTSFIMVLCIHIYTLYPSYNGSCSSCDLDIALAPHWDFNNIRINCLALVAGQQPFSEHRGRSSRGGQDVHVTSSKETHPRRPKFFVFNKMVETCYYTS